MTVDVESQLSVNSIASLTPASIHSNLSLAAVLDPDS
jgi:hypothetical protein